MPELPEVEITRRGIEPHTEGHTIAEIIVREPRLRWPVPEDINQVLSGKTITQVKRRAKYLLLDTGSGHLIVHLGMSGSLKVLKNDTPPGKHDHIDILLTDGQQLRYTDPRRFGAILWSECPLHEHKLLKNLGPEPLDSEFTTQRLFQMSRSKRQSVKTFIMDNKVVVGVGNIYSSEALFKAETRPDRACGKISLNRYEQLVEAIKETLTKAIEQGGTTLRDFVGGDGKSGYFKQELAVYGRTGQPCIKCGKSIKEIKLRNRSSYYCNYCQR